jgi:hypothetical protein
MFGWMLRVDPAPWNSLPGEADGLDGTGSRGWSCGKFVQGPVRESLSGPECCVEIRRAVVLV